MPKRETTTPEQRVIQAKVAAHSSWANTADRSARMAGAWNGWAKKFEKQVDPDGSLSPAERERRAESARKAHLMRMALRSSQVRADRKRARDLERGTETGTA